MVSGEPEEGLELGRERVRGMFGRGGSVASVQGGENGQDQLGGACSSPGEG